ncbi:GerAB/ArcD/ProY family transporter [Halalkalibacter alkaliphilus]|uniref:Spore germination protein n=1 Tax=Halalkalibacter alkaliphilus TaxID=2917993 RepID=A0A9X2CV52_9BACI|nr:GerAB/ArcD/ProY family transporter [Halalkalibacter alkaliphilus]MCL7748592.1 spore germination protein [Halalkalibacter alkaliphilus]
MVIYVNLTIPGGVLLFLLFDYLFRAYPDLILSGYMKKVFGTYIGWSLSLLYIGFFIYIYARNLREAGDLLVSAAYDQTPLIVVEAAMILVVIYILYKGLQVFFRLAEIYLIIIFSIGEIGNVLMIFSGIIDLSNLSPVFGDGRWKRRNWLWFCSGRLKRENCDNSPVILEE